MGNYDLQKQKYELAYNFMKSSAEQVRNSFIAAGQEAPFTVEEILVDFDVALQYSLLEVAIADNILVKEEIKYIRDLTNSGDMVSVLHSVGSPIASWDEMLDWNIFYLRNYIKDIHELLYEDTRRLATLIGVIDAAFTEYNFIGELNEIMAFLKTGVILADGQISAYQISERSLIFELLEEAERIKKESEKSNKQK